MLEPGSVFAGYTIGRLLGAGGMGEVYVANHPRLPRADALKVLAAQFSNDESFRRRFEREADVVAGLSHPAIVAIHDRGEADGRLWIAFELVDGTDLTGLITAAPGGLAGDQVARIVGEVASALDYAGTRGLVHRDVKPANILLNRDGRIRLTDFGIARTVTEVSELTGTGMTLGTVSYASPEQLTGETVDGRSDQYSLACTGFHLLTGRVPFADTNVVKVITAHLGAPAPSVRGVRPDLSPAVDAVLARAMSKDPAQRFTSSGEFAGALAGALAASNAAPTMHGVVTPCPPSPPGPQYAPTAIGPAPSGPVPAPTKRSLRGLIAGLSVAAVAAVVVVVLAVILVARSGGSDGPADATASTVLNDMPRKPVTPVLGSLAAQPSAPRWTVNAAAIGLSTQAPVQAVGGDDRTVFFANYLGHKTSGPDIAGKLVAVDAATGKTVWAKPAELTEREGIWDCKFTASRALLACYANTKVVFLNPASGAIVGTYRDLQWRPDSLDVVGEAVVITGYRSGAPDGQEYFVRGIRSDGSVIWSQTGAGSFEGFGEQGVVVIDHNRGDSTTFAVYRARDGRAVFTGDSAKSYSWIVYPGGFAVSAGFDGHADFYSTDGARTASVDGWRVFTNFASFDSVAVSLPILRKSDGTGSNNSPTVAAIDPADGRVIWSRDAPGLSSSVNYISGRGTSVIISDPGATIARLTVFDAYTAAGGSAISASFPGLKPVDYIIGVDDQQRLALALAEDKVATFDSASGAAGWSLSGPPGVVAVGSGVYLGGSRFE